MIILWKAKSHYLKDDEDVDNEGAIAATDEAIDDDDELTLDEGLINWAQLLDGVWYTDVGKGDPKDERVCFSKSLYFSVNLWLLALSRSSWWCTLRAANSSFSIWFWIVLTKLHTILVW